MTINKTELIQLFQLLGWPDADQWPPKALSSRAVQIRSRFTREEVPKTFQDLYDRLEGTDPVTLLLKPDVANMGLRSLRAVIEEKGLPPKLAKLRDVVALRKAVARHLAGGVVEEEEGGVEEDDGWRGL